MTTPLATNEHNFYRSHLTPVDKTGPQESCLYTMLACHATFIIGLRDGLPKTKFWYEIIESLTFPINYQLPNPVYYRNHQLQERISNQRPQSLMIRCRSRNFLTRTMATVFFPASEEPRFENRKFGVPRKVLP